VKIVFYGYDVAVGRNMQALAVCAQERGHAAILIPMQQKGVTAIRKSEIVNCDVLVTGLSGFETEQELVLVEMASALEKPWVIHEDVPGSCLRPKAKEFAPTASAVILALPYGEVAAKNFGYQETRYLGLPPLWGELYQEMTSSNVQKEGLYKSYAGRREPVGLEDVVILPSGGKSPAFNNMVLELICEAGLVVFGGSFVLAFSAHPGEKPEDSTEEEIFQQMIIRRKELLGRVWTLDVGLHSLSELQKACDITVFAGASTLSIAGAYNRQRMVYLDNEAVRERIQTQILGDGTWFVAELGGALKVDGPEQIREAFCSLMTTEGRALLRAMQETNFPFPETWGTEGNILDFLENTFG